MIQTVGSIDRLVEEYLAEVGQLCRTLPATQRVELVDDLREHIAAARARLPQPNEADIRTILDRLGEPAAIAMEAGAHAVPAEPNALRVAARPRILSVTAVAVLCLAGFALAIAAGLGLVLAKG